MPATAAIAQSPLIVSLSALPLLAPSRGVARTVALYPVPMAAILNAAVAVDGIDRTIRALLPLGVLAVPVRRAGCGER